MKDSQQTMMEHSEVKIRLLKLYLERYLNILGLSKNFSDVIIYDLFCGEGIYDNGGKGSPIVILEEIKDTYFKLKASNSLTGKFHCLFNDIENWKTKKVNDETTKRNLHYDEIGKLDFSNRDYRELVSEVVNDISKFKNQKAFIFIDPYGYKDIRVSDIKELVKAKKSEVLLFLPTQFMFRFETKGTPESLKQFINELMPVDLWPTSETGLNFIEQLTESFRNVLGNDFFVDSFVISRDLNQFFCLFFFTSHIYGFDRMLDAKWKIDEEEGRGWHYAASTSLFNSAPKQPNTIRFEKELIQYLSESRSNADVYEFTLHKGHLPIHTTDILSKLQNDRKLVIINKDGKKPRKGAFYIRYGEYRDHPQRITLKIV